LDKIFDKIFNPYSQFPFHGIKWKLAFLLLLPVYFFAKESHKLALSKGSGIGEKKSGPKERKGLLLESLKCKM